MRLRRLHLAPYGKFRERVLDFGTGEGREADVTLVYGPNEAGKSTLFAAWLDLLFGIKSPTPYSFRYDRKTLRIGAEIEAPEGPLTLWRTGKQKESLTDDDGRAVPEHRLGGLLHGLDRDAYSRRFSLNDEILRKGGDEILAAKGDLGQTLYAGASGLSGLAAALGEVEASIKAVHSKGASKSLVAEKKRELAELDTALKADRLDPKRFEALEAARGAAERQLAEAETAFAEASAVCALHRAAERRTELQRDLAAVEETLLDYPDGPDLAAGAEARLAALHATLSNGRVALDEARDAAREAESNRDKETPDPDGIALAETIAAIEALKFEDGDSLVERARSSALDLQKREQELGKIETRCAEIASDIDGEGADPERLTLPPATVETLATTLLHLREARTDAKNAERELERARKAIGEPVSAPQGMAALQTARQGWQDASRADPDALAEDATQAEAQAAQAVAALPDDWYALASAAAGLPEEAQVAALVETLDETARIFRDAEGAVMDARAALEEAQAEQSACAAREDHVSDAGLADRRRERDTAWAQHRAGLSDKTADAFEQALHADDDARAVHLGGVELRERVRNFGEAVHRTTKALDRRETVLEKARTNVTGEQDRAAPVFTALGLPQDAPAAALRPRRAAMVNGLEKTLKAREARRRATDARERLDTATEALRALLDNAPEDAPGLTEAVNAREAALREQEKAHDTWRKAQEHVTDREGELGDMQSVQQSRRAEFDDALHGLWCAGHDPETLEQHIPLLRDLASAMGNRNDRRHRVDMMRAAHESFETEAAPLREALDSKAGPAALMEEARTRAQNAKDIETRLGNARKALEKAEADEVRAKDMIAEAEEAREVLLAGHTMPESEDTQDFAARLLERDAIREKATALKTESARCAEGHDPMALEAEEGALAPGRGAILDAELEQAKAAHNDAIGAVALARGAITQAEAGAGGAETDQQRALILAELREAVGDAAARMIGLRAANAALDRLRQTRRGPMLERTQSAFSQMTGEAWTGLETRPEGTGERLVALRGEELVQAEGMSSGTRGQLYLSLRLAGHALFCDEAGPLPFVTDDVLETFDDARAAAALDLTIQLGQRGQAILLTHHRHLVDMAQDRIPDLRVIDL